MFRKRHSMIFAAAAALMSAGGSAISIAAEAPEFPDDGKFRIKHSATEQVLEFDTEDQAANFARNATDAADWRPVRNGVPAYMNLPAPTEPEAAETATDAAAAAEAAAPAPDADPQATAPAGDK